MHEEASCEVCNASRHIGNLTICSECHADICADGDCWEKHRKEDHGVGTESTREQAAEVDTSTGSAAGGESAGQRDS